MQWYSWRDTSQTLQVLRSVHSVGRSHHWLPMRNGWFNKGGVCFRDCLSLEVLASYWLLARVGHNVGSVSSQVGTCDNGSVSMCVFPTRTSASLTELSVTSVCTEPITTRRTWIPNKCSSNTLSRSLTMWGACKSLKKMVSGVLSNTQIFSRCQSLYVYGYHMYSRIPDSISNFSKLTFTQPACYIASLIGWVYISLSFFS